MATTTNPVKRTWAWACRHPWLVFFAIAAVAVVWTAVAAIQVITAKAALDRAVDRLEAAQLRLSPGEIVNGGGEHNLRSARAEFADAYRNMSSVFVTPFRVVPVAGRQLSTVRAMSGSAVRAVDAAETARHRLKRVLVEGWDERGQRVQSMRAFARIAGDALSELDDLDLGPSNALIGPVARARHRFHDKLDEARDTLGRARSVAIGVAQFLQGPSRYLLLAANNAEMRAGSGMILNAGAVSAENGHLVQESMGATSELAVPAGVVTIPPGDLLDRWGWLLPNQEWRNLASTPNFPATAELASRMWTARTGQAVDGVLLVDPLALQALLSTSGPITVGDVTLDAGNVLQYIFRDQYEGLDSSAANDARRDRLGDIADATIEEFDHGQWKLESLLDELEGAVDGRHILAWSPRPKQQRAWRAARVSGTLGSNSVMVSLMNFGGNKLDPYLDVAAKLAVQPGLDGTDVRIDVAVQNKSPVDGPDYILGRYRGAYPGILAVDVPSGAAAVRLTGAEPFVAAGSEGKANVLAASTRIERGETKNYTVTFRLPPGVSGLDVAASGRYPGVRWSFGATEWSSGAARHVAW